MSDRDFYVDGMTVDEILSLGTTELNSLNERDMSRALRTVALAANKRIDRLMDNAIKRHNQYIQKKSAKHNIALDALNKLYDEAGQDSKAMRFSVGNKSRNEMYAELSRARDFMNLKTSTVKGAESVRKQREARTFGKTREDVKKEAAKQFRKEYEARTGKKPTKANTVKYVKEQIEKFEKTNKAIWSNFRKFNELNNKYGKYDGSDEVLETIAQRTLAGDDDDVILEKAAEAYDNLYIEQQEEYIEEYNSFWDEVDEELGLDGDF